MFGLSPQVWGACGIVLAVSLGAAYWSGYSSGKEAVQIRWDADVQARTKAQIEQEIANREKERGWSREVQSAQDALAAAQAAAQADLDAALRDINTDNLKLRERFRACQSSRVPGTPAAPGSGDGASQGGLSKADEELALRIASDADRVVHQLTTCQAYIRTVSDDY